MSKKRKNTSLDVLIQEIGGVLKTVRTLRERREGSYHVSNLYRWRDRGYIPPSYWRTVIDLTHNKVSLDQLLNEYESANPL